MPPPRVSIVTLGARDLNRLRQFYRALGWQERGPEGEGYANFRTGGAILALFGLNELADDAHLPPLAMREDSISVRVTLAINCDDRAQVDASIAVVRAAGGTVTREPSETFWGGYSAYFADPEGNLWEIAHNPSMCFDEHGNPIWD